MEDPRYPVGKFEGPKTALGSGERETLIRQIEEVPVRLRDAVADLSPQQLETPYREGGWTVRQVAHHLPDSHMNGYIRFRLALTESEPTIKTYAEDLWAELPDSRTAPVEISLALMDAIHRRWTLMLQALGDEQWTRAFRHPDLGLMNLDRTLALYAWHGRHHVAHITSLRQRMGWS
jgi:uncharacterized damage-inducible protein DinB